MRVLLDEQLPMDLAARFHGHTVEIVASRGWAGVKNGALLSQMAGHYDVLVTMDRSIEFQQNLATRPFGIVVVRAQSNRMQDLTPLVPAITAAIDASKPGLVQRVGN